MSSDKQHSHSGSPQQQPSSPNQQASSPNHESQQQSSDNKSDANNNDGIELSWSEQIYEKGRKPSLRNSHSVTSDSKNKCIYLFGGRSKGGANNQLYCLLSDELDKGWKLIETTGHIPSARKSSGLCFIGGCLYLFGGNVKEQEIDDFYCFNIEQKRWILIKSKGDIPCARDRHSICAINGKMYLFGGHSKNSEFLNDLYCYDVGTNVWTLIKPKNANNLPPSRYEHACTALDNCMIITGGKCKNGGLSDVWLYDVKDNTWHSAPLEANKKKEARWGHSCVAFHHKLITFGGWNGRYCFNDVHVLDTEKWKYVSCNITGVRPSIRTFHGGALINNNLIVVAGRNMKKRLNDTYILELSDLAPGGYKRRMSLKAADDLQNNIPSIPKQSSVLHKDFQKIKISLEYFELKTTLGTGSFGRVRLIKYKPSEEWFAMKMLRKSRVVEMKQENHIKWEKRILSSIRHPFIVNMEASFQDKFFLYLILELVSGGEFFTLLRKTGTLQLPHAAFYSAQIVLVFQFLHRNKIVYRDLKPENLLINKDGYLKLTDFGFAKRLEKPYRTWTLCGTPEYIAPEILLNKGHSFSVDWWALGILLFEMFTGNPPFVDENPMKIYQKILDGKIEYPKNLHARARDFISKLLTKSLSQRLGNLANGAVDVMKHPFFEGVNWKAVLEKQVRAPYVPQLENESDTHHFDKYDSDSDTDNAELEHDPFMNDF